MKLDQLPEDFTPEQFMQLDKESLDAVPYTRVRWLCQCKGCNNGTHVRDYGLEGLWFLDRNSKNAASNPKEYWMRRNNYVLCGKHHRLFKRLGKRFDFEHIWRRLIDTDKTTRIPIPDTKLRTAKRIEGADTRGGGTGPPRGTRR